MVFCFVLFFGFFCFWVVRKFTLIFSGACQGVLTFQFLIRLGFTVNGTTCRSSFIVCHVAVKSSAPFLKFPPSDLNGSFYQALSFHINLDLVLDFPFPSVGLSLPVLRPLSGGDGFMLQHAAWLPPLRLHCPCLGVPVCPLLFCVQTLSSAFRSEWC